MKFLKTFGEHILLLIAGILLVVLSLYCMNLSKDNKELRQQLIEQKEQCEKDIYNHDLYIKSVVEELQYQFDLECKR